jgi:hypothetical protein
MKNQFDQFVLNRRQQRKQRTLFPPFAPVPLLLLFVIICICVVAQAQCYIDSFTGQRICARQVSPSQPAAETSNVDSAAHCRISVADGTIGSGTLVASNDSVGLVLTCSHLFNSSKSNIVVSFPNGRRFFANLIDLDRANDLAALAIRRPDVAPLVVSEAEPTGILPACGFGSHGVFRNVTGNITGHATAAGATFPSTTIAGAVRPGDSGGGVLNTQGQLTGVIWGQRDGQTYATCGQPLREFLTCVRGKLFSTPSIANKPVGSQPPAQPGVPSPTFDWQTWTSELDARIRTLDAKKHDKGDYLQPGDLNRYQKIDDATKVTDQLAPRSEVESKLKGIVTKFESVHNVVESVREHVEQIASNRTSIFEGVSLGKFAVSALGLSGPVAAAVILASGLFSRRIKTRLSRLETVIVPTLNSKPQPSTFPSPSPSTAPHRHSARFPKRTTSQSKKTHSRKPTNGPASTSHANTPAPQKSYKPKTH